MSENNCAHLYVAVSDGLEGSITGAEVDQLLEAGYKVDLAEDLPE